MLQKWSSHSDGASSLKRNLKVSYLDPFLHKDGVLCVGVRLCKSNLNDGGKHPVLLPKEERVTLLIMQWCHPKCAHGGRELKLNQFWSWVTGWYVGIQQSRRWSSIVYNATGYVEYWLNRTWRTSPIHILWNRHNWPFHNKTEESQVKVIALWCNVHLEQCTSPTQVSKQYTFRSLISLFHSYSHWGAWLLEEGMHKQSSLTMVTTSLVLKMSWGEN